MSGRGFFAIGIEHGKNVLNVGTLWRSANIMGASSIFTVGRRYKKQASDTLKTWRHIPLFHYADLADMVEHLPFDCRLVGVELDPSATPLVSYRHPQRAAYLLGAEDHGLTTEALRRCHDLLVLPGDRSLNVSVAGSIVMYDRKTKLAASASVWLAS